MPPITLLSDFGPQDASVAVAKGTLLQHVPGAQLIDISHLVETFNIQQAAYLLLSAYPNFPEGTCHVLLFDVFSEARPRLLLCEHEGQYLLAPDNGVLSLAFGNTLQDVWQCYQLDADGLFGDWLREIGKVVGQLQTHTPKDLQLTSCSLKVAPKHWQPIINGDTVECHVVHIDRYENVVINLTRKQFDAIGKGRPFRIQFMRDEELTQLSTHFYNVAEGQKLCRFNATGFLEICINRGKAASLFGFKLHREKHFIYNTIKVYFG
jgi:S-adenosyl-L-methionine hydrolase (adenosine-forming)